jgi:hypothetical protein
MILNMAITRYVAGAATAFSAAAGTAPFFVMEGSATKTIKITAVKVDGLTLTSAEYLHVVLTKYSTAASGGTAAALVAVPLDSEDAAATANVLNTYTAAPTAGTDVGTLCSTRVLGQATSPSGGRSAGCRREDPARRLGPRW